MKKYLFFLLITITFGCKENLSGHWHAKSTEYNYVNGSIDILENNECYLTLSLSGKPIKGEHFPLKKQIFFPGQCGQFSYDYIYEKNKLLLTSHLGDQVTAERQNKYCHRFNDFKTLLNIDYLKIENKRDLYKPKDSIENDGLNKYINIDFSEESNSIRIEYLNRINPIDQIDSIIKYIENSVSNAEIPFINYVLIPDKKLKVSDLKIVINKLNEGYKKKIYTQILKIKPEKMNIFEYIKINKIQLSSDSKLFYIIN
jgi:hypothetical protein